MSTDPIAIDVSHWQESKGGSPWQKLRDAKIRGVFLKCTEDDDYVDPTFRDRYDAAIQEGFAVSSYHFLRPADDMTVQMNHYLNTLKPRDGERVVLDHEDPGVSLGDLEDCVDYLLTDSRNLQITIYSGNVIKEQVGDHTTSSILAQTSLWLAQYSTHPDWPRQIWPAWSLWQWSDSGEVSGYSPIDVNRFNGPDEAFDEWMGPAGSAVGPQPGPEPEPERAYVTLNVDSDTPINLVITTSDNVRISQVTPAPGDF